MSPLLLSDSLVNSTDLFSLSEAEKGVVALVARGQRFES